MTPQKANRVITKEEKKDESARSFNHMFARLGDGEAHTEASVELHGLLAKLQSLARIKRGGASGKLTITIGVSVEGDMVDIRYDVSTKEPKPPRSSTRCWLSKGGNVAWEDPKQQTLKGIRELPKPADDEDVREAHDPKTGELKD